MNKKKRISRVLSLILTFSLLMGMTGVFASAVPGPEPGDIAVAAEPVALASGIPSDPRFPPMPAGTIYAGMLAFNGNPNLIEDYLEHLLDWMGNEARPCM